MNKLQIRNLLQTNNPTIFEIGCADGTDTLEFLRAFGDLNFKMYCFEPEPRNILKFKNTIKDSRIILYEKAIGDCNELRTFYQSNWEYCGSLLKPSKGVFETWPEIKFPNQFITEVITLDTFVNEQNIKLIDFIWADVQGAEDLLILGGLNALNFTRFLFTEYSKIDDEYYLGAKGLDKLCELLPNFTIYMNCGADILFKNKNI